MCCEQLFGYDVDDVFSYQTAKLVRIRDRRLGIMRLVLLSLIFIYIVIFKVVRDTGYLKKSSPIGTMRFSLLRPLANPKYDHPDSKSAFRPQTQLSYCKYNGRGSAHSLPCEYKDAADAFDVMERSCLITTRVSEATERSNCSVGADVCQVLWEQVGPERKYFTADMESFTLLLDHTMQAADADIDVHASARKLKGVIDVPNNDGLCKRNPTASAPSAPCTIRPNDTTPPTGLDIFEIGTIMEIVDTDLDHVRILQNRTYRDDGIIVVIEIKYSNFASWSGTSKAISYTYSMNRLLDANYKEENAIYNTYPTERVWRDKHGIKLVVLQTGQVGQFDLTTLLVQITTSLTLLATATLIVDLLALRVLPQRQDYTKAKIEVTEDFSDLRERLEHEEEEEVQRTTQYRSMETAS